MNAATPDVPPPRYEQVGGWKHLICDEQEWLARPAPWGIDHLPEEVRWRKQGLCEYYRCSWLADRLECNVCRPFIRALFTDSAPWVDEDALTAWQPVPHPAGPCAAADIHRCARNHQRGIVTGSELHNNLFSALHDNFDLRYRRSLGPGEAWREQTAWNRFLALELVGPNPFRPLTFAPEWRTDAAIALARGMYDSREFSPMPILADALQDAGCDNPDILAHCRDESATHVRGCWVVDLVLGL